ncbi:hypothetical protein ROZALSC1DRAFT_29610 [Rozella allomycis CSF55]|uniref:Uncharacterized protein n=1 Tax=Rozella allomycis (strain CSF55) TaxID=988480 RepID=A0A4P9YI55_ROZAC|nr:hypothetical protein ROZALSC1DRAFT_29610 [Rozella allomycis CSF55]
MYHDLTNKDSKTFNTFKSLIDDNIESASNEIAKHTYAERAGHLISYGPLRRFENQDIGNLKSFLRQQQELKSILETKTDNWSLSSKDRVMKALESEIEKANKLNDRSIMEKGVGVANMKKLESKLMSGDEQAMDRYLGLATKIHQDENIDSFNVQKNIYRDHIVSKLQRYQHDNANESKVEKAEYLKRLTEKEHLDPQELEYLRANMNKSFLKAIHADKVVRSTSEHDFDTQVDPIDLHSRQDALSDISSKKTTSENGDHDAQQKPKKDPQSQVKDETNKSKGKPSDSTILLTALGAGGAGVTAGVLID